MTFFWGQNHKMGERFFSWRVEQAAVANAALPGTLNPKPASPLSTYSLALDFLPRHLEPGPSISPSLPPAPQSQHLEGDILSLDLTFLILTCVRTGDQSIRKGITWADVWKG